MTNLQQHWDQVYRTRQADAVSWFRPHLETSLALIRQTGVAANAPILDVGGGASTLVDDLLAAGYSDVTVLDLSEAALETARNRLGPKAARVSWRAGDATTAVLRHSHFQVWHDRAVFHFLTDPDDRRRYVEQVLRALAPGGHVIVATFGPGGPQRCSGLPTARYEADALHAEFGGQFRLLEKREEQHRTPAGVEQQFIYCL